MVFSMTGFGRAVESSPAIKITVEAKSLNSKQLDLSLRLPLKFRDVEMKAREMIAGKVERGKVDVNVYVENISGNNDIVNLINTGVVRSIKENVETIASELNIDVPSDWFSVFLRFPEVLHNDRPVPVASAEESSMLFSCLEQCLMHLMEFRKLEGEKLYEFFKERIGNIRNLLEQVPKWETLRVEKIREKLDEGLKKISGIDYDKNRLEQELIFYIEKLDISEEKQRLSQHLDYFTETLDSTVPGQGKKLGFIAQEMGREINTLGSKSNQAQLQKLVVMMKDELEQIKEQVLNVM